MVNIVVPVVCDIGWSVEWVSSVVIGQNLFGDLVILGGVMVDLVGVALIFDGGVERGGGRGVVFFGGVE